MSVPPELRWSGKARVAALIIASVLAWAMVAAGVYLVTRWFSD